MGNEVINAFVQEGGNVTEYIPVSESWFEKVLDQFWYNNFTHPLQLWWADKVENIKYNSLDIITVVAIALIATFGLKMFVFSKSREKDVGTIYFVIIFYTIIRLYWRVVLHV